MGRINYYLQLLLTRRLRRASLSISDISPKQGQPGEKKKEAGKKSEEEDRVRGKEPWKGSSRGICQLAVEQEEEQTRDRGWANLGYKLVAKQFPLSERTNDRSARDPPSSPFPDLQWSLIKIINRARQRHSTGTKASRDFFFPIPSRRLCSVLGEKCIFAGETDETVRHRTDLVQ